MMPRGLTITSYLSVDDLAHRYRWRSTRSAAGCWATRRASSRPARSPCRTSTSCSGGCRQGDPAPAQSSRNRVLHLSTWR